MQLSKYLSTIWLTATETLWVSSQRKRKRFIVRFKRANIIQEIPCQSSFSFRFTFLSLIKINIFFYFFNFNSINFCFHWILCPQFCTRNSFYAGIMFSLHNILLLLLLKSKKLNIANGGFNNELTCATYPLFKGLSSGSILLLNRFG